MYFSVVNKAQAPIDFSNDNFTLTASVSGPTSGTQTITVNSGTLNAGDAMMLALAPFQLSTFGVYSVNAYLSSTWDILNDNDSI